MHFERSKKIIASGAVLSLGSISIFGLSTSVEASNKSTLVATNTADRMGSVRGLVIGEKLNKVKIVHPVRGKNLEIAILSSNQANSQNGEDLAVVYSPTLNNAIKNYAGIKNKNEAIGFLFTDGGKRTGVVESIVYFDEANLVVRGISAAYGISNNWQQLYPLSAGPKPTVVGFDIMDKSILANNHRGVEIRIEHTNTPAQLS